MNDELLQLYRCPHCAAQGQGQLSVAKEHWLVCGDCGAQYPIVDAIPVMLPEEGAKWRGVAVEALPEIIEQN